MGVGIDEVHFNKLHRKFNLLSSWLQLKFHDDPSSLVQDSSNEDDGNIVGDAVDIDYAVKMEDTRESRKPESRLPCAEQDGFQSMFDSPEKGSGQFSQAKTFDSSSGVRRKHDMSTRSCSAQITPCSVTVQRLKQRNSDRQNIEKDPLGNSDEDISAEEREDEDGAGDDRDQDDLMDDDGDYTSGATELQLDANETIIRPQSSMTNIPATQLSNLTMPTPTHTHTVVLHMCMICGIDFPTSTKLFLHKYKYHPSQQSTKEALRCTECNRPFLKKEFLQKHIQNSHPSLFEQQNDSLRREALVVAPSPNLPSPCPLCGKLYLLRKNMRKHVQKEHVDVSAKTLLTYESVWEYFCTLCKKGFKDSDYFDFHLKRFHPGITGVVNEPIQQSSIPIDQFVLGTVTPQENAPASTASTDENPIAACPECGKILSQKTLKPHIIRCKNKKIGLRPLLCSECGFQTTENRSLQAHLQIHSDERNYKCKECPYAAKQRQGLDAHIKSAHEPSRLLRQCSMCGEMFKGAYTLKCHVRQVHENLRPFQCTICEKAFKNRTHLNYHIRTHENPDGRKRGLNRDREPKRRAPSKSSTMVQEEGTSTL